MWMLLGSGEMPSFKLLFGILAIVFAYMYSRWTGFTECDPDDVDKRVIAAWQSIIKTPASTFSKVAVGINANVDLIVRGTDLLRALDINPGSASDHPSLHSLDELQEAFSHFFAKGAAVERYYAVAETFKHIVETASELEFAEWYVGGNAALMAQKIVSSFPNTKVQLVGPVGPRLQQLLHPDIALPKASLTPDDEVHLILEYTLNEKWGDATAPYATRFITSHDEANSRANPLETFFTTLPTFQPDLVILSGLHMMEGQPDSFWSGRLSVLAAELARLPPSLPVHLELASMANTAFVKQVLTKVLPHVSAIGFNEQEMLLAVRAGGGDVNKILPTMNSLGLNEQELSFGSYSLAGPHSDLVELQGQPPIHKVTDIILWMLKTFGHSTKNTNSRLTRIHFHSLSYHIIATVPGHWINIPSAVAAGTRIAGRQACDTPALVADKIELHIPNTFKLYSGGEDIVFNASEPVINWVLQGYEFSLSPVLVCSKPLKTVGLGDAISSTGLLYSQHLTK